jgi:hypothetical protein
MKRRMAISAWGPGSRVYAASLPFLVQPSPRSCARAAEPLVQKRADPGTENGNHGERLSASAAGTEAADEPGGCYVNNLVAREPVPDQIAAIMIGGYRRFPTEPKQGC